MKKLGKNLIVISLVLVVLDYGWNCIWGLRIEPAGNAIQLLFLALPYWFNRTLAYLAFAFTGIRMELFWLGFALWFTARRGEDE